MDTAEITPPTNIQISNALTCQKCGCHDPSVRQVSYPYVISLIVFTFRREFHGRWCWKHRTLYSLLAALITGTIGWFGFPFGLIYTPIALYRLVKGGVIHKESNLKLLRSLAEAHEERGFLEGALRCIENRLQFVDDIWSRQELERYYTLQLTEKKKQHVDLFRSPIWLVANAMLLSFLGGLISFYLDKVFDLPIGNLIMLLGPLFFWIPLAIIYLTVLFILRQILENVLEGHSYQNSISILGITFFAGLLAAYGFLEGREIGNLFDILQNRPILPSGIDLWNMMGAVFTRGGLLEIPQELGKLEFWNFNHQILLATIPAIFPTALILAAWPYLSWEKLLNQINARKQVVQEFSLHQRAGRLIPFAVFFCLIGLSFVFPQQSLVDFIEARDHFSSGNRRMDEEKFDQAISEYNIAVQLDRSYTDAYVELGWADYQNGDNQQAITQYTRAIDLGPDQFSMHYDLGRIYYNDDQLEKAAVEFEKTIQLKPDFYPAYLGTGWVAYDKGDLEKAETSFRKVLDYNDKEYDAYVGLGYIYEDRNLLDQQISAYEKAVELNSESAEAHMLLGMAYYDKNELDQAVTSLKKAVGLESDNQLARLYLKQAYVYTGHPDTAVEFSSETLKLFPDWAGAHALMAFSLIETRQVDAAIAEIQAAQDIAQKTDTDRRLIISDLLNADKPQEAGLAAQEAIKDSQHPSNFYLYLAEAYSDQQKYSLALNTCDQAGDAGAKPSNIMIQRASIYLAQDEYDLSQEELQRAIRLNPDSADAHYLISMVYSAQDNYAKALDEAQQATALDRYYYSAYLNLSINQLSLDYPEDAVKSASRAALLSPYADVPHYFLGMAYLQKGMDNSARTELQKFLELYDGSPSKQKLKENAEKELKSLKISF